MSCSAVFILLFCLLGYSAPSLANDSLDTDDYDYGDDAKDKCPEETFELHYLTTNGIEEVYNNTWPAANIGEVVGPLKLCLLESGLSLRRKCGTNEETGQPEWKKEDFTQMKCIRDTNENIITPRINNLYTKLQTSTSKSFGVATKLENLLKTPETLRIPADLDISAKILEIITRDNDTLILMPKILKILNLLMQSDENVIFAASTVGTTKSLLQITNNYFDSMALKLQSPCSEVPNGVLSSYGQLMSIFYIYPNCSNITGIAISSTQTHDETPATTFLHSLDDIKITSNFQAAAYFPKLFWRLVERFTGNQDRLLRFSWVPSGNFFIDKENYGLKPVDGVVQMSVPDYNTGAPLYIPIIFQNHHPNETEYLRCASWDYESWSLTNITLADMVIHCNVNHRMPFHAVVDIRSKPQNRSTSVLLTVRMEGVNMRSIIGCILSLFGLFCIFLTALFFEDWCSQFSNKLLLNICLVLMVIMSYFLLMNMPNVRVALQKTKNQHKCVLAGAFLQYMIMVLFLWMLFIALLQYFRYASVYGRQRPRHFILICALAAWSLPLIPSLLVMYLDPQSYTAHMQDVNDMHILCHPTGASWYLGVLLPISLIIVFDTAIFAYILWKIRRSCTKFHLTEEREDVRKQVRKSILLISVLGVSWIIGIAGHVLHHGVFELLFCFTSTLQGLFLFIHFVVVDKKARTSWMNYFCYPQFTSEVSSIATVQEGAVD